MFWLQSHFVSKLGEEINETIIISVCKMHYLDFVWAWMSRGISDCLVRLKDAVTDYSVEGRKPIPSPLIKSDNLEGMHIVSASAAYIVTSVSYLP